MEYIKAGREHAEQVYRLVRNTITAIYPKYYPKEIVDFFCELHNQETILKDIEDGRVSILLCGGRLTGTGSYQDNHITRVYVDPKFQGQGYGSYIMQCLEKEIAFRYDRAVLDASLPASHLYEARGYTTVKHEKWPVKNGVVLVYEIMEKRL